MNLPRLSGKLYRTRTVGRSKRPINVGAATEIEMKEKKARVEDALHATRAAVAEGVVPGGGVAYIRSLVALDAIKCADDEKIGLQIVRRALEAPFRQIVSNTGGVDSSVALEKVKAGTGAFGYNALTEQYEDLYAAGVIDPAKVTRSALQNAASVASLMLTTETIIAEKPDTNAKHSHGGAGGGMPGMEGMM